MDEQHLSPAQIRNKSTELAFANSQETFAQYLPLQNLLAVKGRQMLATSAAWYANLLNYVETCTNLVSSPLRKKALVNAEVNLKFYQAY